MTLDTCHLTFNTSHWTHDTGHMTLYTWNLTQGPWHLKHNIWHMAHDTWHKTFDTWVLPHDTWHITLDTWYLTHDTWHLTHGIWHMKLAHDTLHFTHTGCPTKKFTSFKPVFLWPLISLRKSSVLEMNLWISSFKNTNSKFSRIFVLRDIKGIRYYSCISGYSWPTFGRTFVFTLTSAI